MAVTQVDIRDNFGQKRVKINQIATDLGDKAVLTTTDKTSAVAAINEINSNVGTAQIRGVVLRAMAFS